MSSIEIEMPARVASLKPDCISLSAKTTVSFSPHLRNEALISRLISFFLSVLLMLVKGSPLGRISESSARPAVVSTRRVSGTKPSPSALLLHSVRRTLTRAVISTSPQSSARCSSARSANTMPSPRPLMRSRVA